MSIYPKIINGIPMIGLLRFLEIGTDDGLNFRSVLCDTKHSIDPNTEATFKMTSDEFFQSYNHVYDIVLIDGNHDSRFVFRDWNNSITHISPGGLILIHDMFPGKKYMVDSSSGRKEYCGDGYKILYAMVRKRFNLKVFLKDYGLTAIFTHQPLEENEVDWNLDYDDFRTLMKPFEMELCLEIDPFCEYILENLFGGKHKFDSL